MSEDWDSVTRIGSKVRSGGGVATDKQTVVKGRSALNAAQRTGAIIGTEKKYGGTNSVSTFPSSPAALHMRHPTISRLTCAV